MFAPKNYESRFFQYYLHHAHRPALTLLTLETDTLPAIYNLAKNFCSVHKIVSHIIKFLLTIIELVFKSRLFNPSRAEQSHPTGF